MAYQIKLDIFEGPLDLLLHLIRKNEVDVYDIPIAVITEQYLEYIEMLRTLNLDVAGEFLLMASTLVHIKSKMLLPPDEEATTEEEGRDPRAELVQKLLEYQRYKDAAERLDERNMLGRDVFSRSAPPTFEDAPGDDSALVNVTVFDLMEALQEVLKKIPKDYTVDFSTEKFRIVDKINQILETLEEKKSITFVSLFMTGATRGEVIVTFLATLELCKLLMIRVHQTDDGVIRLYLPEGGNRPGALLDGVSTYGSGETGTT
jgi:segregation and condensation protein A